MYSIIICMIMAYLLGLKSSGDSVVATGVSVVVLSAFER